MHINIDILMMVLSNISFPKSFVQINNILFNKNLQKNKYIV